MDSETAEDIGHRLLKEAQLHYFGENLANITYPSRVSAQRVRDFVQRQSNCIASLLEQIRVARDSAIDDGPGEEKLNADLSWRCDFCGSTWPVADLSATHACKGTAIQVSFMQAHSRIVQLEAAMVNALKSRGMNSPWASILQDALFGSPASGGADGT
jgi:hypothetical protein